VQVKISSKTLGFRRNRSCQGSISRFELAVAGTIRNRFFHMGRILATLCIGLLAVLIGYKVVFGANGTVEWRAKRAEYQRLQQWIQTAAADHEELEDRVKRLQTDPNAIVKEAREKLGYVMPGEVVLVPPQPKPDLRASSSVAQNLPAIAPKKK
jgi:cell division protein FtsB